MLLTPTLHATCTCCHQRTCIPPTAPVRTPLRETVSEAAQICNLVRVTEHVCVRACVCVCMYVQVGESYERAYTDMVRVQQITELEEVIAYKKVRHMVCACMAGKQAHV